MEYREIIKKLAELAHIYNEQGQHKKASKALDMAVAITDYEMLKVNNGILPF